MKNKILILTYIISVFISQDIYSQVNGKFTYKTILKKNGYAPIIQELTLFNNKSNFKTIHITHPNKVSTNEATGVISLNPSVPDSIQASILSNYQSKIVFTKLFLQDGIKYKKLFVFEKMNINWVLNEQQSIIKGYTCKKATTTFRGRDYEAWYVDNIQTTLGPWKFHGLPGLLIKITDSKNEVLFTLEKIELFSPLEVIKLDLSLEKEKGKISIEDYFDLKVIAKQNTRNYYKAKILSKLPRGSTIVLQKKGDNDIEIKLDN